MQAHNVNSIIASKNKQIAELNDLATSCSQTLTGMPHTPSKTQSTMADAVIKIVELQEELSHDILYLINIKKQIGDTISQIKDADLRTLLEYRYLCTGRARTWESIADTMGYDVRYIQKLHGKALVDIQSILDKAK